MNPHILERLRSSDPTLTHLKLDCNRIGAEGARALAEALRLNRTLIHLNLDSNQMGDEGAQATGRRTPSQSDSDPVTSL